MAQGNGNSSAGLGALREFSLRSLHRSAAIQLPNGWPDGTLRGLSLCFGTQRAQRPGSSTCSIVHDGTRSPQDFQHVRARGKPAKRYEFAKGEFDKLLREAENLGYKSACLHSRIQEQGESVDQFATALRSLAQMCGRGMLKEKLVRDCFILVLQDKALSGFADGCQSNLCLSSQDSATMRGGTRRQQDLLQYPISSI